MDLKEIRKLVELMTKNDLCELEIQDGQSRVLLKRGPADALSTASLGQVAPAQLVVGRTAEADSAGGQSAARTGQSAADQELEAIVSPMVGTFYQATHPESDPFVQVGDTVTAETIVCIVEAMKVMNEIKAGLSGVIEKTLVANGEAVEFGQQMYLVRPT